MKKTYCPLCSDLVSHLPPEPKEGLLLRLIRALKVVLALGKELK